MSELSGDPPSWILDRDYRPVYEYHECAGICTEGWQIFQINNYIYRADPPQHPSQVVSMKVKQLIQLLERFNPDADVRLCVSLPNRVIETHESLWVGDYGGGPQINAVRDFKHFFVYVGCGLEQLVSDVPQPRLDLGDYANPEDAAKVQDFYALHRGLHEPLNYPDFDYEHWIPPRTSSGQYNPIIAQILREKLLKD